MVVSTALEMECSHEGKMFLRVGVGEQDHAGDNFVNLDPYTALLRLFSSWDQGSFEECIQYWFSSDTKSLYFPLFFFWGYGDIVICFFLKICSIQF